MNSAVNKVTELNEFSRLQSTILLPWSYWLSYDTEITKTDYRRQTEGLFSHRKSIAYSMRVISKQCRILLGFEFMLFVAKLHGTPRVRSPSSQVLHCQ